MRASRARGVIPDVVVCGCTAAFALWLAPGVAPAQLKAGDIAVVACNSDSPDGFAWVALASIPSNTVISFTDSSCSNNQFYWSEHLEEGSQEAGKGGPLLWWHSQTLTPGAVVRFDSAAASWSVGTASNHYPNFSAGGDQIFAYTGTIVRSIFTPGDYQGDAGAATFLYGLDFGNAGWGIGAGTSCSHVPAGLSTGAFTAVYVDDRDNGYYSGIQTGTVSELKRAIANPANWTTSDARLSPSLWPSHFEVLQDAAIFEFTRNGALLPRRKRGVF
jgi:hypothetical protein